MKGGWRSLVMNCRKGAEHSFVHSISGVIWHPASAKYEPGGQHTASTACTAAVTSK